MSDTATYVYAATTMAEEPAVEGVAGEPIRFVGTDLRAAVSTVPLAEFSADALRRNLENLQWLESTARSHHRVVAAIAEIGPVVPLALCTVYRDDDRVADLLRERSADFRAAFEHTAGRREWGVKILGSGTITAPRPADNGTSPGTAYLQRRRAERADRARARAETAERADAAHAALCRLSADSRRYQAREQDVVLSSAHLVDLDREAELFALVEEFRGAGLDIRLTGPWAPYSFSTLEKTLEKQ